MQADSVFVFDEPTIGLHPLDVQVLLGVFQALIDRGATVVVIEHDLDVIRNADYIIDMGPGGGEEGGRIVAAGTLENGSTGTGKPDRTVFVIARLGTEPMSGRIRSIRHHKGEGGKDQIVFTPSPLSDGTFIRCCPSVATPGASAFGKGVASSRSSRHGKSYQTRWMRKVISSGRYPSFMKSFS